MMAITVPTSDAIVRTPPPDRLRTTGLAVALVTGPWLIALADGVYAFATRNGGDDVTGEHAIALAGAHQSAYTFAVEAALLGSLMMVAAAVGASRVIGPRAAKLGLIASVLVGAAYVADFAANYSSAVTLAMARRGGPMVDYAAVLDSSQGGVFGWVAVLFILGNVVGTLLLGIAFLRSRVVPVWAALLVVAWMPIHIAGLVIGSEWFEVVGMAAVGVAFAAAARVLRAGARG
jgi:hypothetical protein